MSDGARPEIAVVGAGPAGLAAAERLAGAGCAVTVYERMPSVARKFLLAGRGGLNLTHSEPHERLLARYGAAASALELALAALPATALRDWCESLGVETFVGTSGRVFPKSLKASPLLRAWLRRLAEFGVAIETRTRWVGFEGDRGLTLEGPSGRFVRTPDASVLALGGASWPRLGSDGSWVGPLAGAGISVAPLQPANCGFVVPWTPFVSERFAGEPIKRAALSFEGETARGEAMVTSDGIEGGLIYALSGRLRDAIARNGEIRPMLDLRPDLSEEALTAKLAERRGKSSLSTHLRKAASLSPAAVAVLREGGPLDENPAALARRIKATPLRLVAPTGLDRAISTAGGVTFDALDDAFMLKRRPGTFVAGEMLDWEAPTGGYLLQASFATAVAAAEGIMRLVKR
ncbi:TIGR03862 family flavoprotein [Hansschlegelia quercus]|uniref:TIGR03862 family flavoprotein n=1 Tax=Hansschlegelia quercus TaxID=2528245 RepID=UPI0026BFB76D